MKKKIWLLAFLALGIIAVLAMGVGAAQDAEQTTYKMGDANMDGAVNTRDVVLIKQSIVGMKTLTEEQKYYADVYDDGTGTVNTRDAVLILQHIVGMDVVLDARATITFETNGGTPVAPITAKRGTAITAPAAPTKSGYTFGGWYTDTALTQAYTFDRMPNDSITLYAKWNINSYTISFNSNGGSAVAPISREYGAAITAPINPTKSGYTFVGWYTDAALTQAYTFGRMPNESITLYAKWEIATLTITYQYTTDYSFYVVTGAIGNGSVLEIPRIYDGLRVIAIAKDAFAGNTQITKVVLPNTIETVGEGAFYHCTSLSEVIFAEEGTTEIKASAFEGCTSLASVTLPVRALTKIGDRAFANCTALKNVLLPSVDLQSIGKEIFQDCTSLESIVIPDTLREIPEGAFQRCASLLSATLQDGLRTVGHLAFDYCKSLNAISFPDTVTSIGNMAFRHAEALKTVSFSPNLTAIGNATFQYCISLPAVELHERISQIGKSAFSFCTALKDLRVLGPITLWGSSAFYDCTALESIYIKKTSNASAEDRNYIFYNAGIYGAGIALTVECDARLPEKLFVPNGEQNLPNIVSRVSLHAYETEWTADDAEHWYVCSRASCDGKDLAAKQPHTFGEWIVDTAATCQKTGTRHHVCTVCNKSVSETIPVDANAHNYATTWTAVDDTYHEHKCQNSGCTSVSGKTSHTFGEWIVDEAATCMKTGEKHHVCTKCQKSVSEIIPVAPSAHTYDQQNTKDVYRKSVATCTSSAVYYYSCACGAKGSTTFESGALAPHTYNQKNTEDAYRKSVATCTSPAIYYYSCVCGLKGSTTFQSGTPVHIYASVWTTDDTYHWRKCTGTSCTAISEKAEHSFGADHLCTACNNEYFTPGLQFAKSNGTYDVSGYTGNASTVYIPSKYQGVAVTSIGEYAFKGCTGITSITIPDSVEWIGNYAFQGCTGLTSVTIPDSVEWIGNYAFRSCTGISSITVSADNAQYRSAGNCLIETASKTLILGCKNSVIPTDGSVSSIGASAFQSCRFTSIAIPESVTSIGTFAFYNCTALTSVIFDENSTLESIGASAFEECTSLESIAIPDSVTSIGPNPFACCTSLASVTFGENSALESIGTFAFACCPSLESITIPDGVTSIGDSAFYDCTGLTTVTFGENSSLKSIGEYAFLDCTSLESITIPDSVTSIGYAAFKDCEALESITLPFVGASKDGTENTHFGYIFGASSYPDNSTYVPASLKTVVITGGTSIDDNAFDDCTGLTSITIPDSVTSIGYGAFSGCTNIQTATLPTLAISVIPQTSLKTVVITSGETIGDYAFRSCSSLTSITIPDSVTSIGDDAFYDCDSLTSITIPSSVTSIGSYAFAYCGDLMSITFGENSKLTSIGSSAFKNCMSLMSVTIPSSVTSIGSYAFKDCDRLTSINIPSSVTSIGDAAFSSCSSLTSITVEKGNTVYHSAENCLIETKSKTLIAVCKNSVIPTDGSVTSIGDAVFSSCSSLTSITIPDSVTSIGDYAFNCCYSLTSITFGENSKLTSIGSDAFHNCDRLTSINIPSSVTSIGSDAFAYCGDLMSITFGENSKLTSIGDAAFSGCSSLMSITIPDSVTSIGYAAFYDCDRLTSITLPFVGATKDGTSNTQFGYIFGSSGLDNDEYVPTTLKTVVITGGTSIGNYAFYNCTSLASITIPSSVKSIGSSAFYGCTSLTSITLPFVGDGQATSGYKAHFGYIFGVKSTYSGSLGGYHIYDTNHSSYYPYITFDIPASLKTVVITGGSSIPSSAFAYCKNLTSITIPDGVESIGASAFSGCTSLKAVYITDLAAWCGISFSGSSSNPLYYAGNLYLNGSLVTDLAIPDSVTSIGSYAFWGCSSLTSITIPDSVTSIGTNAFSGCTSLASITIPDSVTNIASGAFYNCTALTSITFKGTQAQWNEISKGSSWDTSTGSYTVYCTDGTISK